MTEDEDDLIHELRNEFSDKFQKLCALYLCRTKKFSEARDMLRMMMQECTSVYHPGVASEIEDIEKGLKEND